ncbi:protein adenylyltransferase SelO [Pararhodobacter sp. SW119]|uniref:protein adenylyltransferase SelO n=1 Tax=Pararhodobacter sp. SW119 TaxID=2780075 RepID=UPI001AE03592|nr:YdiU family protein [Pararhodobacter sp. SW119]
MNIAFDNTYARDLEGMYVPVEGAPAPAPEMVLLNEGLARDLGLDPATLKSPEGLAMLSGSAMPEGATPLAMAYAGHQFGGFSPQLGDGRALLVGEVIDRNGQRRDIHLKGSGRTPFSRGGDGKAALGPVLREFILGEAMHRLGIPTTRALSAVATGETVWRETPLPGAVLARVAASHLRVGTFQFFAARGDAIRLRRLADYAIARHDPDLAGTEDRYLRFLERVIDRTMRLVAQWMAVGFVHGVMNTDNTAISGETIDYGPCAFLDRYDPMAVFSSIDTQGRYAYGRQSVLAQWNLARLAETLLPLIDPKSPEDALPAAQAAIERAPAIYAAAWRDAFAAKLGIAAPTEEDDARIDGFLELLGAGGADFTQAFRGLIAAAQGSDTRLWALVGGAPGLQDWLADWRARIDAQPGGATAAAERMATVNPVYIARNHRVEEALAAAQKGDLAPTQRLLQALSAPYTPRPDFADLEGPAPEDFGPYVTYCGT